VVGGSSCRALDLTRALTADGHAVRAVTRSEERRPALEAAGAECWIGTPDRIGTLRYALENVTVLLWLLGTAAGGADEVAPLHGSRLRFMLERVTDSTVRGVVYEQAGTVAPGVLEAGAEEVRHANRTNEIPFRLLHADPRGPRQAWLDAALACIGELTDARRG
jgi:hypothetical protein